MSSVSVIIPTYNRADLLERSVRSCLAQTHPVHEVLVCDDGSTDGSEQRMRSIGDARVKWISGPHAGRPAPARNRGIAAATGEWIAFQDSDDEWRPEKLRTQLDALHGTAFGMCSTNAERIVPGERSCGPYFTDHTGPLNLKDMLRVNRVICSSVLVRNDLLQRAGDFPEAENLRGLEDYALWLRLLAFTEVQYCPEPLVLYRDEPSTSVRADRISEAEQRDRVLTSLRTSKAYTHFNVWQRLLILRNLRGAHRASGRNLSYWLLNR
jgi:glycosyltransferase involved in cell wall biosynthesis